MTIPNFGPASPKVALKKVNIIAIKKISPQKSIKLAIYSFRFNKKFIVESKYNTSNHNIYQH